MSLLAALVLAAATARVESVSLTTLDARLAVRVQVSGTPGLVAVHREGEVARVSIMDADLGLRFAGARRFSWTPSDGFDPALLAATPAKLDRLEIAASASEVSVLLHVPPEVSVDVRRDSRGLLLVFRDAGAPTEPVRVARATPVPDVAVAPSRWPRHRWPSPPSSSLLRSCRALAGRAPAGGARPPRTRRAARGGARGCRGRSHRAAAAGSPSGRHGRPREAPLCHGAGRGAGRSPGRDDRGRGRPVPAPLPDRRAPGAGGGERCRRPRSSSRGRTRAWRSARSACARRSTRAT